MKKAQQDWKGLVADLNDLVRQFPADNASWQQLAEVYLMLSDNLAAVHCLEELVLLEPRNAHYHSRLAEALYSAGSLTRSSWFIVDCLKIPLLGCQVVTNVS